MDKSVIKQLGMILGCDSVIAFFFARYIGYHFWPIFGVTSILCYMLYGWMWLSVETNHPGIWQILMIISLGISSSFLLEWGIREVLGAKTNLTDYKKLSILLIGCCLLVNLIGFRRIKNKVCQRIDLWFPPLWAVIAGMFVVFVIDGKRDYYVRCISILILVAALVLVSICKGDRRSNGAVQYEISMKGYIKWLGIFAVMVFMIGMKLPLASELPYTKEIRATVTKWMNLETKEDKMQLCLSRTPSRSNAVELKVTGEGPLYLRRLAYSIYDHGKWAVGNNIYKEWTSLGEEREKIYPQLSEMLTQLAEGKIEIPDLEDDYRQALNERSGKANSCQIEISEQKEPTSYLSVNGVYEIKDKAKSSSRIGYNGKLEDLCFTNANRKQLTQYSVIYQSNPLESQCRERIILEHMTYDKFSRLVSQLVFNSKDESEALQTLEAELPHYEQIKKRYTQVPDEIAVDLRDLANFITLGHEGDLDKAQAIEAELRDSGKYIYKLGAAYTDTANDPILDFLLYGKAGICQDFASSMVLLCRSVGLPARYVEGYYASEKEKDEKHYVVRRKDAHAYAEVYIAGYGWMTFDPTTSYEQFKDSVTESKPEKHIDFITSIKESKERKSQLGIGIFLILLLLGQKRIREWVWVLSIAGKPATQIAELILNKTLRRLEEKEIRRKPDETLTQFANRVEEKGIEITPVTRCFEDYYYGGKKPYLSQLRKAYSYYNALNKSKTWKKCSSIGLKVLKYRPNKQTQRNKGNDISAE